jgi:hypothetical protein
MIDEAEAPAGHGEPGGVGVSFEGESWLGADGDGRKIVIELQRVGVGEGDAIPRLDSEQLRPATLADAHQEAIHLVAEGGVGPIGARDAEWPPILAHDLLGGQAPEQRRLPDCRRAIDRD